MEIPKFLLEMSEQINNQNNRVTADPLFEVRYKSYLITQEDYNESHWEIFCEDGCTLYHSEDSEDFGTLAEYMLDCDYDWCVSWFDYKDSDLEFSESNFKDLFADEFDPDFDDLPSDVKKLHLQEVEVTVNSHFTESDAQAFIDRKQHDYRKLYIYAISMCYCENMKKLRNWIKGLTTGESVMSDTPKSNWVINKNYFTVKPVDQFRLKYKEWMKEYDPGFEYTDDTEHFIDRMTRHDFVHVYEYPHESPEKDYFEMSDDNHVIPRHLFELVN